MNKSVFVVRRQEDWYNDEGLVLLFANEIYGKFDTLEEAQVSKIELSYHFFQNTSFGEWMCGNGLKYGFLSEFIPDFIQSRNLYLPTDYEEEFIKADKYLLADFLEFANFQLFVIWEVQASHYFYKIFTNPNFNDFQNEAENIGTGIEAEYLTFEIGQHSQSLVYEHFSLVEPTFLHCFYRLFVQEKRVLKGTLTELSQATFLLENYLTNSQYLVYDAENQILTTQEIEDKNERLEIMRGLVALLRPDKVPFLLKAFPVEDIEVKKL
jgi:hypothetical protein